MDQRQTKANGDWREALRLVRSRSTSLRAAELQVTQAQAQALATAAIGSFVAGTIGTSAGICPGATMPARLSGSPMRRRRARRKCLRP